MTPVFGVLNDKFVVGLAGLVPPTMITFALVDARLVSRCSAAVGTICENLYFTR